MGNFISPLRRALRKNNYTEVERLLNEAGQGSADLINEDYTADCFLGCCMPNVQNPLHTAIGYEGRGKIVELLIQKGADVDSTGWQGQTPLHKACRRNNLSLAQLLVQSGANPYIPDNEGWYPIHTASMCLIGRMNSDVCVLAYMVEEVGKVEDIHLKDDSGNTPLHLAATWDNDSSFAYLLEKGADLNAENDLKQKPLDIAGANVRKLDISAYQK